MQITTPLPFTRTALALAITAAMTGNSAMAQEAERLEPVVVTAAGYEQALRDAPASISVISGEELSKQSYSDITDAMDNIPGVYVTGGGGSRDISIRGMSKAYTLYMVDGRPISDGRSVNTNANDQSKQITLPTISMIERIEVIRGPMSSLYGYQAMCAVVNIITN